MDVSTEGITRNGPHAGALGTPEDLSNLLERSPDLLLVLDEQLRVLKGSGAPALDRAGDELQTVRSFFGESAQPVESRCREALATGHEMQFPLELGTKQYSVHVFAPHPGDGHGRKLYFLGRDVTDLTQAKLALARSEQERQRLLAREYTLLRESEALAREAERSSRTKDEFLATLSHELRTPLNAILGWTQMLKDGGIDRETLARALAQVEQSAQAQAKLVDDLLNVSDIVAGRVRLDMQPMRLADCINAVVEALYPAIEAKDIHIEIALDPSADFVEGDPARIQQILWNLLSNAVKFTPQQGSIRIDLAKEGNRARITLSDSGEGIRPEFLPQVFDRFRQADASSRKRHGGLGLGLSIARYLVEMHGGSIEGESAGEGQGATFRVTLPLLEVSPSMPASPQTGVPRERPASRATGKNLSGLRVLTVDDDRSTREMLEEALRRAGAEVMTAESAREALEKVQRFLPHVLVSDIGMPVEDGYDLVRKLRRLPAERGGNTPAIALTGYAREEDRSATWEAGYQAMTPKPVSLDELLCTVAAVARREDET